MNTDDGAGREPNLEGRHDTKGRAFWRGLKLMLTTPGLVLFATAIGFGALARDSGLTLGHTVFLSAAVYALPAQVVLVDQLARGASIAAAALAVTLTAVRLLPMTVSLLPYFRDQKSSTALRILTVHFIAVTAWVEGNRRLPDEPRQTRLPFFLGLGIGMAIMTSTGSAVGYYAATGLPTVMAATLLFATPVYFLLALFLGMRTRTDMIAIAAGALLGPILYRLLPGLDLLLTGLIGGTIAVLAGRTGRS
ncbi:MAG TPA: AzlC family ABC transporter permease [Hyphomicrobiaceae bacterium]|nr:AzlC family ABC transporter permease [Hyphomicrobiaceae bacterium]